MPYSGHTLSDVRLGLLDSTKRTLQPFYLLEKGVLLFDIVYYCVLLSSSMQSIVDPYDPGTSDNAFSLPLRSIKLQCVRNRLSFFSAKPLCA